MSLTKIAEIYGHQVIVSRADPTVAALFSLARCAVESAVGRSRTSTGGYESRELRDRAEVHFCGAL
jgi:enolase